MAKVKITIDGKEIVAEEGSNLLETARCNGIEIPSLCHDSRLEPFGACRQCLVEVEGGRGPVQACGAKVQEGMIVRTATDNILGLRRLGLELLLTEHTGDCIAPCQLACPAEIDIQGFVAHIANGRTAEAAALIREKMPFPASIGRVCPRFCEQECRRNLIEGPVSICFLKRFAGDFEIQEGAAAIPAAKPDTGKQVAVVGGGPAGLTAAYYLALEGHRVTIFEAAPELGGMMRYGIPEYRLPKAVLDQEIRVITELCQTVVCNKALGRDFTLRQLKQMGFDAIFIGLGSWANQSLRLEGEDLGGVYSGIGFLGRMALKDTPPVGSRVVVIGGGNTAMDAARTAVRLGVPEVTVVYRRSRDEMPANPHEITQAEEEGVRFELLTAPVGFIGEEERVTAIRCVKMQLGEVDSSGRRRPVAIKGSEFEISVDTVITAAGQKLEQAALAGSPEIALNRWGDIEANSETYQCQPEWLFSGGDCVTGPATAVAAVAAGRKAALSIDLYLRGDAVVAQQKPFNCSRGTLDEIDPEEFADRERIPRTAMPTIAPEVRKDNFKEFETGFTKEMAAKEVERCLSCGCLDVFECRVRNYAAKLKVTTKRLGVGKPKYPVFNDHPHIIRDPNKCILCGNCVRVCQEFQGVGALGFVNRGSDTVVLPSLKSPLAETLCKSCGQCVAICPTGALTQQSILPKPGPWQTKKVESVCPYCNVGCKLELEIAGGRIVAVTSPVDSITVNGGDLCARGAFGYDFVHNPERLVKPLVRKNGRMEETSWDEAIQTAGNILRDVRDTAGLDSVAVAAAPGLTNEETYTAHKLGRMALGASNIYGTVPVTTNSLLSETGRKGLGPSFADLMDSDLILVVGGEISDDYPIVAHKIRKAAAKGSKVMIISPGATSLQSIAALSLKVSYRNFLSLFEAFLSYVFRYDLIDPAVRENNSILIDSLKEQIPGDFYEIIKSIRTKPEKIVKFLQFYLRAQNPVVVVDGYVIGPDELDMVSLFTLITGNLTGSGKGLITLYPYGNIRGQLEMGVRAGASDYTSLIDSIKSGAVRGLLIVSDGLGIDSRLMHQGVKTIAITPFLQDNITAEVILPGATFAETEGSYTNCEGRMQHLAQAFLPPAGKDNRQIMSELACAMGCQLGYNSGAGIQGEVLRQLLKRRQN